VIRIESVVRKTIQKYEMLQPGDRVVVGVSGGPDSIALLRILQVLSAEYRLSLLAAHLDHGLRPEGEKERLFVQKMASAQGVPLIGRKADVRSYSRERGLNLQEAAREVRYSFLREVAQTHDANKIALGHTADDQAESVLMRFLRGSGTRGLSGIPPVREGFIIRPLIEVWREDIETYLRNRKIPYLSDPSNESWQFLRSRIRHELLPHLQKYNPQIRQTLIQMAELFRAEERYWQTVVEEKFPPLIRTHKKNSLTLDISLLARHPSPLRFRLIRLAVEKLLGNLRSIHFSHILSIDHLVMSSQPNKTLSLPQGLMVRKAYHALTLTRAKEEALSFEYFIEGPGFFEFPEIGRALRIEYREARTLDSLPKASNIALLNGETISFPLTLRSFRPGDRFQPLGMDGEKKVKDFFMDQKIPILQRKKIPLLFQGDQLLWVTGLRIDHRARIKPDTKRILLVEIL